MNDTERFRLQGDLRGTRRDVHYRHDRCADPLARRRRGRERPLLVVYKDLAVAHSKNRDPDRCCSAIYPSPFLASRRLRENDAVAPTAPARRALPASAERRSCLGPAGAGESWRRRWRAAPTTPVLASGAARSERMCFKSLTEPAAVTCHNSTLGSGLGPPLR
jgi:hypothetical protein